MLSSSSHMAAGGAVDEQQHYDTDSHCGETEKTELTDEEKHDAAATEPHRRLNPRMLVRAEKVS